LSEAWRYPDVLAPDDGAVPRISVIVSAYRRPDLLELALRGFARQDDRRFELIVADDGSGPEVRATALRVARETGLEGMHLWHPDAGFRKTTILNRAILAARGDYLLFTDGDCVPRADLVAVHRRLARPRCFLAGGCLRLPAAVTGAIGPEEIESARVTDLRWLREQGWKPGRRALRLACTGRLAALLDRVTSTAPDFQGNNASAWRDELLAVNGFDCDMGYGGEDRVVGFRMVSAGARAVQVRHRAITMHLHHEKPYRVEAAVDRNHRRIRAARRSGERRAPLGIAELPHDPSFRITRLTR
jgi:glycosyltransferase involved in cell wall biosynthesis